MTETSTRDEIASVIRKSPRMGVNVPARVVVRGSSYEIRIRNISRFGAFVIDLPELERGTEVTLQLLSQNPRKLEVRASVVYWIDEDAAERLGNGAGAGIRFDVPIDEQDTQFGAALTCLLVEQTLAQAAAPRRRADKPTPRMLEPVQAALCSAMKTPEIGARGKLAFAGLMAVVRLPEVLMTLARLRICGRLDVTCGGIVASIDLEDGDIVGVRSSNDNGDPRAVMYTLLSSRTGTFRLISQPPQIHRVTRLNVTHLLIEHVQRTGTLPEIPPPPR